MITTPGSFTAEINIANANISPTSVTLQGFIDKYEPLFLDELFGVSFAALFVAGLGDEGRWDALNTASLKIAIADYIYCYYQEYKNSDSTGTGIVKAKDQNADRGGIGDKICRAWNEMVDICWKTIPPDATIYPEYVLPDWYNGLHPTFSAAGYRGFATVYVPNIFVRINKFGI